MNYDENFIQKQRAVKLWIEYILNINLGNSNIFDSLRDGRLLCKIMNKFHNRIDYIHYSDIVPLPVFKKIENVNLFLKKCRLYVPKEYLFNTNDLINNERIELVLDCLIKLSEYFELNNIDPIDKDGEMIENPLDSLANSFSNNNNNNQLINNNNNQIFMDENERENYLNQQQREEDQQNNSGISSEDGDNNNNNNNSTIDDHDIIYSIGNNNKKRINKKKLALDCIIEVKYSIIIPLFVSIAAGFGIKMGRTMFVIIESFNYSQFLSNSYNSILHSITSKLYTIPKYLKYDQIKDYLSSFNLNLTNK